MRVSSAFCFNCMPMKTSVSTTAADAKILAMVATVSSVLIHFLPRTGRMKPASAGKVNSLVEKAPQAALGPMPDSRGAVDRAG